jgi:hypothetical protein
MKNSAILIFILTAFVFEGYSQTEKYNLESKNLHRKVRKTIEHYYKYDKESGGFVKGSVNIDRYNNDGNLIETYYLYNSKYSENTPVKKLYNYNSDELLMGTKDISDKKSKYSSEYKFTYNKKGHLIKRESVSTDGSKYLTVFKNDRKGRVINEKQYNKKDKLTADINYTYKGNIKTENKTSYSSTDGSIIGNYVTTFNNNVKTLYKSDGKYGNSSTNYTYDKEGNLLTSNYSGKTSSKNTYDYVYDKKDNWIKKHYRSGKYQYFYFREIYFENGDVTGSTEFDKRFINRLSNFANVEVVALKKAEKKKSPVNNTSKTNSAELKNKTWSFDYVYLKEAVKSLKGSVALELLNSSTLKLNADATMTIHFSSNTFSFDLTTKSYKELDDKYQWKLSNSKGESALIWVYKKTKLLKDDALNVNFNVNGLFIMKEANGSSMTMYLK